MCGDTEINSSNLRVSLKKLNKQSGRDQATDMAHTIQGNNNRNNGHSWDPAFCPLWLA